MSGRMLRSLVIACLLSLAGTAQAAVSASERTVLLNLYTSTGGAAWNNSTNWNGPAGTECTWHGVTCDGGQTSVTGIDLSINNLTGNLPGDLNSLTNLQFFVAHRNQLTGPIPALTGLTNLQSFEVGSNQLTGSIPALTGLTNLFGFEVEENQLTGSIPALTGLTNLAIFGVYDNQLTGPIPALTGLSNLTYFYVYKNQLTGSIPPLTGLTKLVYFHVYNNQLTGPIPALTGLTNLFGFRVNDNQLTGSIPVLTGLTNLFDFRANNNQLTGSIPALTGLTNLIYVIVDHNQLTGSIPALTGLTRLAYFIVYNNQLTGSIPALTGLTNLYVFAVLDNQLTGSIPALTDLTNLYVFAVSNNQLSGNVPSVPSPSALVAGGSTLCPNFLSHTPDLAWDAATGVTPWYTSCTGGSPILLNTLSRKFHGLAGTFDLPLGSFPSNPTTEPRLGPAHTIVFTFDKPINAATAAVTEGGATPATPTFSGNSVVVGLSGVTDMQYVTVALTNVAATDGGTGGSGTVRVGFLVGDVNQSRVVSVADLGMVNAQLSQPVTATNYLKDVNASGTLSLADKGITNANLTRALPAP